MLPAGVLPCEPEDGGDITALDAGIGFVHRTMILVGRREMMLCAMLTPLDSSFPALVFPALSASMLSSCPCVAYVCNGFGRKCRQATGRGRKEWLMTTADASSVGPYGSVLKRMPYVNIGLAPILVQMPPLRMR